MSDCEKELERAILDDRMKAFKAEVESNLNRLSGHKKQLLSLLSDSYDRGTKAEPFDADKSWSRIETTAYQYFARQILKQTVTSGADRGARYRVISDTARKAISMIDEARRYPDLGNDLIKAWLEGTKELSDATDQFGDRLYIELEFYRKFDKALESLTELEAAANQAAANEVHKGRGRPKGTSDLPWNYIYALAEDYRKSTGLKPGAGEGPFARFVRAFLTAIGQDEKSEDYVIDVIKDARIEARKNPRKSKPSPFDA
jgi:hypothetical protein